MQAPGAAPAPAPGPAPAAAAAPGPAASKKQRMSVKDIFAQDKTARESAPPPPPAAAKRPRGPARKGQRWDGKFKLSGEAPNQRYVGRWVPIAPPEPNEGAVAETPAPEPCVLTSPYARGSLAPSGIRRRLLRRGRSTRARSKPHAAWRSSSRGSGRTRWRRGADFPTHSMTWTNSRRRQIY